MGLPPSILFLEDDSDLGAYFWDLLEMNGRPAVVAETMGEMVARKTEVLDCNVAFLDIDLGHDQPNGVDAYRWLVGQNFSGRVYFLTGHARNAPMVSEAMAVGNGGVEVLSKPISAKELLHRAGVQ